MAYIIPWGSAAGATPTAADGSPLVTPDMLQTQRQYGLNELQQGESAAPIQSWTQGAARLAQALMGGMAFRNANQQEMAYRAAGMKALTDALNGGGGAAPAASGDGSGAAGGAPPPPAPSVSPALVSALQARGGTDITPTALPVAPASPAVAPMAASPAAAGASTPGMARLMSIMMNPYVPQGGQQLASSIIQYKLLPHEVGMAPPGSVAYDKYTGQPVAGGVSAQRGDGSAYDLDNAQKAYKAKYGEGANIANDAPDFAAFYASPGPDGWKNFGKSTPASGAPLPGRGENDQDVRRQTTTANAIAKNYQDLPIYKLAANAPPYLGRIDAAANQKNSAGDIDLVDAAIKLATGGGQITEAQTAAFGIGASYWDKINIAKNKLDAGGFLSDNQRQEIQTLSHRIFDEYKRQYQPIHDASIKAMTDAGVRPQYHGVMPDLNALSSVGAGASAAAPMPGAKQASDGNWYVSDPNRPGKYLMVQPNGAQ